MCTAESSSTSNTISHIMISTDTASILKQFRIESLINTIRSITDVKSVSSESLSSMASGINFYS